jgi:two-component system chemotaxis response regulator CheV
MEAISNIKQDNTKHQLAVFYTGTKNIYAINIAKIKAFIITADVSINDTPSDNKVISGIATIRGEPITLVNLDIWLGNKPKPIEEYKLIIYCEFNRRKIGILVTQMLDIVEKSTNELKYSQDENTKTSFSTYVKVDNKDEYCVVFNAEQLLQDIGFKCDQGDIDKFRTMPLNNDKLILVAEDSHIARDILINFFKAIRANYEIYQNGKELLDRLKEIDLKDVGLVITDLEMPVADGYEVSKAIKSNPVYANIPVIVNSSMATDSVTKELQKIGVERFVEKTDLDTLYTNITLLV